MAIYRFRDRIPKIGNNAYVSDSARVIGDVNIGDDCYVGHGVVLRGDYGSIRIGNGTAVEENTTVHIRPNGLSIIGESVTIGHGAILHCNRIDAFAVIGMGAVLSFDVEIGRWSIVAEGSVVTGGTKIPPGKISAGVPSTIVGQVKENHKKFWKYAKQLYVDLAHQYPKDFVRIG